MTSMTIRCACVRACVRAQGLRFEDGSSYVIHFARCLSLLLLNNAARWGLSLLLSPCCIVYGAPARPVQDGKLASNLYFFVLYHWYFLVSVPSFTTDLFW